MQYWPRKRSRHSLARIRSWAADAKAKPLGFVGYKTGMTHILAVDNRPKSQTKGEKIFMPTTIIDCPPMAVAGVSFYVHLPSGWKKSTCVLAEKLSKDLGKKIQLPKKKGRKLEDVKEFDDLRLLVHSQPRLAGIGTKKPKMVEVVLGGSKENKLAYAREVLGKEISIKDVFEPGNQVDVHGVTKGKGVQGTVKRYGVPIRQHKAEKTKRGIATLGSWTPKRVEFTVAQPGKMGYHQRTEYNKQIIKISEDGKEVNPAGGFIKYGLIRNPFLLVKGSIVGPRKRAVLLTLSIRPQYKFPKEAPEVAYISR